MEKSSKPSPSRLSCILVADFPRTRSSKTRVKGAPMIQTGYKVTDSGASDRIFVQWVLGDRYRPTPPDRRLALQQEELTKIQEFLERQGYPVKRSTFFAPSATEGWNQLSVFGKGTSPEDEG